MAASTPTAGDPTQRIHWRDLPRLRLPAAATVLGCSLSRIYVLAETGRLTLTRCPATGRTHVPTADVLRLLDAAVPHPITVLASQGVHPRSRPLLRQRKAARQAA